MNFISRNINIIGILLLTTFAAAAAGLYWNVPQRLKQTSTNAAAAKYICPMHPEITSDKPGDCPKCGMALVLKTAASDVHAGCNHSANADAASASAATEHDGCNHELMGGGCCGTKASAAQPSLPSGCTRNFYEQTAVPAQ